MLLKTDVESGELVLIITAVDKGEEALLDDFINIEGGAVFSGMKLSAGPFPTYKIMKEI